MSDDRYRVVLLDGGGQCAGWLSNRLALVNAAWESGEWTYEQAQVNAMHANRAIRKGMSPLCRWYPVPVRLDDTREHYGGDGRRGAGMRFIAINPGSGPVAGTTGQQASANMLRFLDDVRERFGVGADVSGPGDDRGDGRWTFHINVAGRRTYEVDMPGAPLEHVRWMDESSGDIWDFPRLYVDGSSWIWTFAVGCCDGEDDEA